MQWATENMFSVWAWPSHVASASHLFFPIILGGAFRQTMAYLALRQLAKKNTLTMPLLRYLDTGTYKVVTMATTQL